MANCRISGVIESLHRAKRRADVWMGLIIRRLGLDLTHEYILGVGELILIQCVVLDGRCDEPDFALFALDVEASAGVDGDVCEVGVEVVVSGPEPVVFYVEVGCCFGDVHRHEGADA